MITEKDLKKMCKPYDNTKAYYRPFICNGELSQVKIFFVGINPATPIYDKDIRINEYVRLLLNYDDFIAFYKTNRIRKGKTELSRTRTGINSFMDWLRNKTDSSILETNAITYPTENLNLLWKEPLELIDEGKKIFYDMLLKFMPNLLILHGKETVVQVVNLFNEMGFRFNRIDLSQRMEQMENQVPLINFEYPNGKKGYIISCRHFMYYGRNGNSFTEFRNKLEEFIKGFSSKC